MLDASCPDAPMTEFGSPKSHEYSRMALSTGPESDPFAWNETGTPHSAVLFGPAFTVGGTFATGTEKSIRFESPVGSVMITWPECGGGDPPRKLSGKAW